MAALVVERASIGGDRASLRGYPILSCCYHTWIITPATYPSLDMLGKTGSQGLPAIREIPTNYR